MSSEHNENRYVICPVCHKTNPAEAKFCQFCWGAALGQQESYSEEELVHVREQTDKLLEKKRKTKLFILGGIGVVVLVLLVLFFRSYTDVLGKPVQELNSNSLDGDWAMFRHDVLHTGSAGDNSVIPEGKVKWTFDTDDIVRSSPAVAEGKVFIGSQDHSMYALNLETGDLEWEYITGSRVDSSAAVVDGVVYFGSNDSKLYAVDVATGKDVWLFDTDYPVRSSPAIADDMIYFGADDYFLYGLDKDTGKLEWRFDTNSPGGSSPVIQDGLIAYGAGDGYSYILNAVTGQMRLKYHPGYTVTASAAIKDGTVYFLTTHGLIIAVDEMARTWLWEHELRPYWKQAWAMMTWIPEPPEQSGLIWNLNIHEANPSTPVIDGDTMYMGAGNSLMAVDLETLTILWKFETDDFVRSSPALANGILYVGSSDGNLYAVDAESGEMQWKYDTGDAILSSPAVVDGVIYVGSSNGTVYAIE